ncbi:hypothetical protein MMC14_010567 [Varicellaria rhodocarpa]|nr:hypothetical protein [Varicellaria rhodocarpa]
MLMATLDVHIETPAYRTSFDRRKDDARFVFNNTIAGHYRDGRTGYNRVGTLLITWEQDDMHLREYEASNVDRLESIFRDRFRFEIQKFRIPSSKSDTALLNTVSRFAQFTSGHSQSFDCSRAEAFLGDGTKLPVNVATGKVAPQSPISDGTLAPSQSPSLKLHNFLNLFSVAWALDLSQNSETTKKNAFEGESQHPRNETNEVSGPDYRSHVIRKENPIPQMTLYNKNDQMYLKMARNLQGPFTIARVNPDGTYQLETESGKIFRDGARERDLQPFSFPNHQTEHYRLPSQGLSPERFPEPFGRRTEPLYDEEQRSIKRIDSHPKGYPQLAVFINSDENFSMRRRFGFLPQRVLLYGLDDEDQEDMSKALQSRKLDDVREGSCRRGLIQAIDDKLKDYANTVQHIKLMSSCKDASTRNHNSVSNWLHNNAPLSAEETEFIHHKADLIALGDREENGWFDGFIEDTLSKIPSRFTRLLFTSQEQLGTTDDGYVRLYSKARINILVRLVIFILAVVQLMVPVALLLFVSALGSVKIIVIVLFALFFSVILSICTRAKRHEVLGATAA